MSSIAHQHIHLLQVGFGKKQPRDNVVSASATTICPRCGQIATRLGTHSAHPWDADTHQEKQLSLERYRYICRNSVCANERRDQATGNMIRCKVFTFTLNTPEMTPRHRYTRKAQQLVSGLVHQVGVPYSGGDVFLKEQLHICPSRSTRYRWGTQVAREAPEHAPITEPVEVIGTDAMHGTHVGSKGAQAFTQVTMDVVRDRPVLVTLADNESSASVREHLKQVAALGIQPRMVIVDFGTAYPNVIPEVFPSAEIQYCIFHLHQLISRAYLKDVAHYRGQLTNRTEKEYLFKHRYELLRGRERLSVTQRMVVSELLESHRDSVVAGGYVFKEMLRRVFQSTTVEEARARVDCILEWEPTFTGSHLAKCFPLIRNHFEQLVTFLRLNLPYKTNNSAERQNRRFRKLEKIHYKFRSTTSKLLHFRLECFTLQRPAKRTTKL